MWSSRCTKNYLKSFVSQKWTETYWTNTLFIDSQALIKSCLIKVFAKKTLYIATQKGFCSLYNVNCEGEQQWHGRELNQFKGVAIHMKFFSFLLFDSEKTPWTRIYFVISYVTLVFNIWLPYLCRSFFSSASLIIIAHSMTRKVNKNTVEQYKTWIHICAN